MVVGPRDLANLNEGIRYSPALIEILGILQMLLNFIQLLHKPLGWFGLLKLISQLQALFLFYFTNSVCENFK